jgi:hypothetical protein
MSLGDEQAQHVHTTSLGGGEASVLKVALGCEQEMLYQVCAVAGLFHFEASSRPYTSLETSSSRVARTTLSKEEGLFFYFLQCSYYYYYYYSTTTEV